MLLALERIEPIPRRGPLKSVELHLCSCDEIVRVSRGAKRVEEQVDVDARQYSLAAAGIGSWRWDPSTDLFEHDAQLLELLGLPLSSSLRSSADLLAHVHEEDRTRVREGLECASKTPTRKEVRFRSRQSHSTTEAWLVLRSGALSATDTAQPMVAGVCFAQIADGEGSRTSQKNERPYSALADAMPLLVWMIDPEGNVHYFNRRIEEMDGSTQRVDGTWDWLPALHPDDRERTQRAFEHSLRCGDEYRIEHRVKMRDQGYRWFLTRAVPVRNEQGEIVRWYGTATDVHELKEAHEELRRSQERLRAAQAVGRIGTFEWDIQRDIFRWTPELEALYGLPPGTFAGTYQEWMKLLVPEDRGPTAAAVQRSMEQGHFECEWRVRVADGTVRWLAGRGYVHRDESGTPKSMIGANIDITAHRAVEDALRENAERLRLAMDGGNMGAWDWDVDSGTVHWDERQHQIWGIPSDGFGDSLTAVLKRIHVDDQERVRHELQQAVENQAPFASEFRVQHTNGEVRWLMALGRPFRQRNGQVTQFVGVNYDVTERKQREEELREVHEVLSLAQRASRSGVWQWDLASDEIFVTPQFRELYGFHKKERVTYRSWLERIAGPDRTRVDEHMKGVMTRGGGYSVEFRAQHPVRGERWIAGIGTVLDEGRDARKRLVGIHLDVTDRKRVDEELERYRYHLEQLVHERSCALEEAHLRLRHSERMATIGTLSAGIGHDIGNLLLPIRAHLDALNAADLEESLRAHLGVIADCTEYLQRLSRGLRLLSNEPEARGLSRRSCSLPSWWNEVSHLLRTVLPSSVTLEADLPVSLPAVRISASLLTQAVFNLVQNSGAALHGRPAGKVEIRAGLSGNREFIKLSVRDNGGGMPPEVLQRCLEPFFTTKPRGLSTGLGLALVAGIARGAGGDLSVESTEGVGTTITMDLPVADAAAEGIHPAPLVRVALEDPRLAGLVRNLVRALGGRTEDSPTTEGSVEVEVLVCDEGRREELRRFLATTPTGRAVAVGATPSPDPRVTVAGRQVGDLRRALERVIT